MLTKLVTISTAHIKQETSALLDADALALTVYKKGGFGWFVSVTDFEISSPDIPDDLRKCLEYAKRLGCDWLCLDSDGEVISGVDFLDIYEWQEE